MHKKSGKIQYELHLRSFQNSWVFKTDLLDFHKMTVAVIKTFFQQFQSRIINYRDNYYIKTMYLKNLCCLSF